MGHVANNCTGQTGKQEEVNQVYGNMNSNTYHPGLRNHPNLRYGNPANQLNPNFQGANNNSSGNQNRQQGQGYNQGGGQRQYSQNQNQGGSTQQGFSRNFQQPKNGQEGSSSNSESSKMDSMFEMMKEMKSGLFEMKNEMGQMRKENEVRDKGHKALEKQVGQLAEELSNLRRDPGKLPSDTQRNPNHSSSSSQPSNNFSLNQVSILRSGKIYDNKVNAPSPPIDGVVEDWHESDNELEFEPVKNKKVTFKDEPEMMEGDKNKKIIPFPSVLNNSPKGSRVNKRGPQQEEMWDIFKQVKINIPLIDAIKKIPAYAKYLKEMCTQKRNHKVPKQIKLTGKVSAVLTGSIPPKLGDPGTPIISIQVGNFKINRALLDLGASVSILPGSLYDQYDFGPLQKVDTTVVLADLTPKLPRGMVEDVIVRVEDFYYPVDFLVLDFVRADSTKQPTVILGRPFLATSNAIIDCKAGMVDMTFGNRRIKLNVFSNMSYPLINNECYLVDIVDRCSPHENEENMAEVCSLCDRETGELMDALDKEEEEMRIATVSGGRPTWTHQVESLPENIDTKLKSSLESPPKLELKELPKHLKYAFVGENSTLPVIIASNLTEAQEGALMKVLVEQRAAIGWTIADLKGISPSIVMHKIITEEGVKPSRDAQRRLNPNMREVVKKEVLKWLDAGIIYAISDSTWVSPTQTVPKKAGIQIVRGEKGEEIATRPVTGWRV